MSYFICLDKKKGGWPKMVMDQYPLVYQYLYSKTMLPLMKKQLFIKKEIASTGVCLVKHLVPASLEVH